VSELARIVVVFGLVAANAFFVAAEYAIVTARRGVLAERAGAGSRRARAALRLMDEPVRVISTVQVAITAISILTGAIGEPLVRELLGGGLPTALAFLIAFGVVTYLTVVFGELVPKAVSLDRAESVAVAVARPVELLGRLLWPFVWVLGGSARAVLRLFGIEAVVAGRSVQSAADLRAMVDEAEESGFIPRAQEELLHNVFDFASREAADVMVPAQDVAWLDAGASPEEALDAVIDSVHTRFPVGEGSLDRLVGVVHAREIAAAIRDGGVETIGSVARPAYVIPMLKDLGALLREMRELREQLAIVVSEYGSTVGIITIEDVLEEIVGDIESEYELPDARIGHISPGRVVVSGSITIDDFNEEMGTRLPQDGPRTIAGLVFESLGRAAREGDRVEVPGGASVRVVEVDGARITKLEVDIDLDD